jgi:hypothetical protein
MTLEAKDYTKKLLVIYGEEKPLKSLRQVGARYHKAVGGWLVNKAKREEVEALLNGFNNPGAQEVSALLPAWRLNAMAHFEAGELGLFREWPPYQWTIWGRVTGLPGRDPSRKMMTHHESSHETGEGRVLARSLA